MADFATRIERLIELDSLLGDIRRGLEIRKFAKRHNISIDTVREDLKTLAKLGYEARPERQDVIATHRGSEVVWRYIEAVRFLFSNNLHWLANV